VRARANLRKNEGDFIAEGKRTDSFIGNARLVFKKKKERWMKGGVIEKKGGGESEKKKKKGRIFW